MAEVRIPKALPYEKSVEVARRALSATLNWGKHHLAQEPGLFRESCFMGECDGDPFVLPMAFVHIGDNPKL